MDIWILMLSMWALAVDSYDIKHTSDHEPAATSPTTPRPPPPAAPSNTTPPGALKFPQHFKLGLLAPWTASASSTYRALTSAASLGVAMDHVAGDPGLAARIAFSVVTRDSACNSKKGAGNAVRLMVEDAVDVFMGPPCSVACRPAAELASYWNKPIVTWGATDPEFRDRATYSTLSRVYGPHHKLAEFVSLTARHYGWLRLAVLSSPAPLYEEAAAALRQVLHADNVTLSYQRRLGAGGAARLNKTLTELTQKARIVAVVAPREDQQTVLLAAHARGFTRGEYVFLFVEVFPYDDDVDDAFLGGGQAAPGPVSQWAQTLREASRAVLRVTLAKLDNDRVESFKAEVARRMHTPPWNDYAAKLGGGSSAAAGAVSRGDVYSIYLYDAVMLYAQAINASMDQGTDFRSGEAIAAQIRGRRFEGLSGTVVMDAAGDRQPDYRLLGPFAPKAGNASARRGWVKLADITTAESGERLFRTDYGLPVWPSGKSGAEHAPPDTPRCGFRGDLCPDDSSQATITSVILTLTAASLGVSAAVGVFLYRRTQYEAKLLLQGWKVNYDDIELFKGKKIGSLLTLNSSSGGGKSTTLSQVVGGGGGGEQAASSGAGARITVEPAAASAGQSAVSTQQSAHSKSMHSLCSTGAQQIFAKVGFYSGMVVAIKPMHRQHLQVTRSMLIEFSELKEMVHENLNLFIGACIEPPNICLLWQYCHKGSLQDVLGDDSLKLDNIFKLSFMTDIVKGMQYLHSCDIGSHGNLKSSNCLVDNRWTIRITDFGLAGLLALQDAPDKEVDVWKTKNEKCVDAAGILFLHKPISCGKCILIILECIL